MVCIVIWDPTIAAVPLTRGLFSIIDAADLPLVSAHKWCACPTSSKRWNFYAKARIGGELVSMHRVLMRPPPHLVVDHINGDGLDNRRSRNLRNVSQAANARNQHRGPAYLAGTPPQFEAVH